MNISMEKSHAKCLLLINTLSGRGGMLDIAAIKRKLEDKYGKVDIKEIKDTAFDMNKVCKGYDYLAVGGGDGTLNNAINYVCRNNINLIYIPAGTLNDSYRNLRYVDKPEYIDLGKVGQRYFSYVLAAGTFTPIGYNTNIKLKKAIKQAAYFLAIFREYKVNRIKARISIDTEQFQDEYTLIMIVNSKSVFGFGFNKLYSNHTGKAHLLLISTPKRPASFIKLFFLFFRAFFIGFNKPVQSKNLIFKEFSKLELELVHPTPFCIDGEKQVLQGSNRIVILKDGLRLLYL